MKVPESESPHEPRQKSVPSEKLLQVMSRRLKLADLIFDHIENGALVTDADGYILYFNRPYARFLGIESDQVIGRHITDVLEDSRMHIVAQTGKAELNKLFTAKGRDMVVQRIPIFDEGRVVAAFGQIMFKQVSDVGRLANNLSVLESKLKLYEKELISLRSTRYNFDSIRGTSAPIVALKEAARKAALTDLPILITGESGTGKELFAQAIHQASSRHKNPSIHINCAAIPKDLFEAELFGYAEGAFTGAKSGGKPGKFELADGGTLFLDEIGEMPLELQPKLLRVLEDRLFERVGGNRMLKSDFRIIAATNRDLQAMVKEKQFREDLYYRLNVVPLEVPPLRGRQGDLIPLARHLLDKVAENYPGSRYHLTLAAEKVLDGYHWPGNIRELLNVLERTAYTIEGSCIDACDLPFYLSRPVATALKGGQWCLNTVVAEAEREALRKALELTGNNKAKAAKLLGIHRTVLYKKMSKYQIPLG
jgi:transcriptional regulator with PAS, ATPase and Fis domain